MGLPRWLVLRETRPRGRCLRPSGSACHVPGFREEDAPDANGQQGGAGVVECPVRGAHQDDADAGRLHDSARASRSSSSSAPHAQVCILWTVRTIPGCLRSLSLGTM